MHFCGIPERPAVPEQMLIEITANMQVQIKIFPKYTDIVLTIKYHPQIPDYLD